MIESKLNMYNLVFLLLIIRFITNTDNLVLRNIGFQIKVYSEKYIMKDYLQFIKFSAVTKINRLSN